MVAVGNKKIN